MGKAYFEFLEEEFQALTSQLQKSLAASSPSSSSSSSVADSSCSDTSKQFTRCQAVLQQLGVEASGDSAFQDRLALYKIQLKALQDHYREQAQKQSSADEDDRREVTYTVFRS